MKLEHEPREIKSDPQNEEERKRKREKDDEEEERDMTARWEVYGELEKSLRECGGSKNFGAALFLVSSLHFVLR